METPFDISLNRDLEGRCYDDVTFEFLESYMTHPESYSLEEFEKLSIYCKPYGLDLRAAIKRRCQIDIYLDLSGGAILTYSGPNTSRAQVMKNLNCPKQEDIIIQFDDVHGTVKRFYNRNLIPVARIMAILKQLYVAGEITVDDVDWENYQAFHHLRHEA